MTREEYERVCARLNELAPTIRRIRTDLREVEREFENLAQQKEAFERAHTAVTICPPKKAPKRRTKAQKKEKAQIDQLLALAKEGKVNQAELLGALREALRAA